jgi:spore germination protein
MRKCILIAAILALAASAGFCAAGPVKRVFAYYQVPALDRSADESLQAYKNIITDLSPTIVEIMDGMGKIEVTPETKYLDILKGDDTTAIAPLIRNFNFDKKLAKWCLLSPTAQRNMVASGLEILAKEPRYSGLVVDIENTSPPDRLFYTEFIARFADALHPRGYKLYAVVGPKEQDIPKSLWVRAFDYKALGQSADYVILMTYNEHWRGGPPGPCASLDWFESCVKYAIECMPPEKIIVGIPFYGYDWPEKGPATSLTHKKARALIERVKPDIQWHEQWATPYFTYTENGVKHEAWFEDVRSVQAKLDVCRKLGVGGVAVWRLGDEDPRFWEAISRYSKGEREAPAEPNLSGGSTP